MLGCTCALLLETELEASEGEGAPEGGGMGGSRGLGLVCFATAAPSAPLPHGAL